MTDGQKLRVMIAGIGGASLGTELLKCLVMAGRYEVFGCDVSPNAYGLYDPAFSRTFLVARDPYVASVIAACRAADAHWLVPGGEQPMVLLGAATAELAAADIHVVGNVPEVVTTFSDKGKTFDVLAALGFAVPRTAPVHGPEDIAAVGTPCIVKPATGSGGSAMVFFAVDVEEAMTYAEYIRRSGGTALAQEYIGAEEGEFTVGVLSFGDGVAMGSIALRRSLDAKLSVMSRGRGGIVSSGYSQGYVGDFPAIRARAEAIARAVGSRGPLNVQGRVRAGELIPFEINPRLSASTYLRALAGLNEVDALLQYAAFGRAPPPASIRDGWYLRSLTERYVAPGELKT